MRRFSTSAASLRSTAAIISEDAFEYLDAPILRVASADSPVPYAPPLEAAFLPSVDKVVAAAKRLVEY